MTARRQFSSSEKMQILRLHLLEHKPISEVCQQHDLNPNLFYRWQQELFEHGSAAFERTRAGNEDRAAQKLQKEVTQLKARLASKDEVIAEIMAEQVRPKKRLVWPEGRLGPARCPRRGRRLCAALERPDRHQLPPDRAMDRHPPQQVLSVATSLRQGNPNTNPRKGRGFEQPVKPHEHWHIDISYLNIQGTFYYLCSVLDGYSRFLVAWDIRESMTEQQVEIVLQRARERFPDATPRIISDNGPQFIAKDFKQFVRINGMTHVRTSPYYPQSNGKLERFNQSVKVECIQPKTPLSLDDARRIVIDYVRRYNMIRLHSAIGYITPQEKLEGRATRAVPRAHPTSSKRSEGIWTGS
ncbi:MAG TPA: IS3 family transposase [Sedimentisphaerales bacterium]|nr:IS3 family transposase [Sedimentisphaerales bacterium]